MNARYPEFHVAGSPREMGQQFGEAARELIREFVSTALERVRLTMRVSQRQVDDTVSESWEFAKNYSPDSCEELQGMALAAGLDVRELMMLQIRNQLQNEPEAGCSSISLNAIGGQGPLLAQNWDNDPGLDPFTVVLTRRPTGKPALINITQAGLIAYIGFNESGIGVCLNTLPAPSRPIGVPHYFTVRGIYESKSLDGAIHAVQRAHRAIPANIMLATPQGAADLEVTMDDVYLLTADSQGRVTHTNHCRHPALAEISAQFPELIQSRPRLDRIDRLLSETPNTVPRLQKILRNHDDLPRSLCRHANDDPGFGHWQTVFSVIIEPTARRMHVARGTPCDKPYEVYELNT
ncbi:C45 family autoproteolytic acyltransferase/hydolase [Schlesneria paludicola]|uniref:C45 family autoproteolytic acyltransferase/hydolase n=1 Tax=Schlesneria paludicola TaxID=360056 RepID=UPI00029AAB62|nr:C45 family peptidase [Schlesneria paludicola]